MKAAAAWAAALGALGVLAADAQVPSDKTSVQRVCVYYDAGPEPSYKNGRLHAIMLENLLGHFRGIRVTLAAVSGYHVGDMSACDRAAYMGSYFGSRLPAVFLHDVAADAKPFLWASYNIRQLQNAMGVAAFAAKTGFVYDREAAIGKSLSGAGPSDFYSDFYYKGRRFKKLAFKTPGGGFIASPDICLVRNASAVVLSTASDPVNGKATPYITRKRDFFYVADNPFLFIHERDRYLILADVLFDFVGRAPAGTRRWALIRLEDIHPNYNLDLFYQAVEILKKRRVPFAVSLIPDYVAPGIPESAGVEIGRRPEFLRSRDEKSIATQRFRLGRIV
ncbi:MAG: DUF2334 domain-containing protein [Elusimicrobia bacterium]|nr:DUF2334 domain-containing protein [Elusimicrobiota bacterium]